MVQKVLVEILGDIDGCVTSETVPFSLDGVSYEIDLSEETQPHCMKNSPHTSRLAAGRAAGRFGFLSVDRPTQVRRIVGTGRAPFGPGLRSTARRWPTAVESHPRVSLTSTSRL